MSSYDYSIESLKCQIDSLIKCLSKASEDDVCLIYAYLKKSILPIEERMRSLSTANPIIELPQLYDCFDISNKTEEPFVCITVGSSKVKDNTSENFSKCLLNNLDSTSINTINVKDCSTSLKSLSKEETIDKGLEQIPCDTTSFVNEDSSNNNSYSNCTLESFLESGIEEVSEHGVRIIESNHEGLSRVSVRCIESGESGFQASVNLTDDKVSSRSLRECEAHFSNKSGMLDDNGKIMNFPAADFSLICKSSFNASHEKPEHSLREQPTSLEHCKADLIEVNSHKSHIENAKLISSVINDEVVLENDEQKFLTDCSRFNHNHSDSLNMLESLRRDHSKGSTSEEVKITHMKCSVNHRRNFCSKCELSFTNGKKLLEHLEQAHNHRVPRKRTFCQYCSLTFTKKCSLFHHMQKHASFNQNVCLKCGEFVDQEVFDDHIKTHVSGASFKCDLCHVTLKGRHQYNTHMEGHSRHICFYCGPAKRTSFSRRNDLLNHYKTSHSDLPPKMTLSKNYQCNRCARSFTRPSLLKEHLLNHQNSKYLECDLCERRYASRSSLAKHYRKTHSPSAAQSRKVKKDFHCSQCAFTSPSLKRLSSHSKLEHNTSVVHCCTECDYKSQSHELLRKHVKNRHSEKRFLCDVCGSMFRSQYSLKHHTSFNHSEHRNFECGQCDKTFKSKSCLSRHNRSHSSSRPYKCECGSCYKQLCHLKRHRATNHGKPPKRQTSPNSSPIPHDDSYDVSSNEQQQVLIFSSDVCSPNEAKKAPLNKGNPLTAMLLIKPLQSTALTTS